MSLTAGAALNEAVDLDDPEDIADAILNRQPLAIQGDDAPWEMLKALRDQAPIFESKTQGMTFVTCPVVVAGPRARANAPLRVTIDPPCPTCVEIENTTERSPSALAPMNCE